MGVQQPSESPMGGQPQQLVGLILWAGGYWPTPPKNGFARACSASTGWEISAEGPSVTVCMVIMDAIAPDLSCQLRLL